MVDNNSPSDSLDRLPARRLILAIFVSGGILGGMSIFTFTFAEGGSYLSDNPRACANCHVMNDHLRNWGRGTHHAVATCNDCHAPKSLVPKYAVKGINGFNHSVAFTTGRFKDPFQITDMNVRVAEQNCRRCHGSVTHAIDFGVDETRCTRCHESVGH